MSWDTYAVNDYGIILSDDILIDIARRYRSECDGNTAFLQNDVTNQELLGDFIPDVADAYDICYLTGFTGDARAVYEDGCSSETSEECFNYDEVVYLHVPEMPGLFKAPYTGMGELVDYFRQEYGEYLPQDFDYAGNLRHFVGVVE